MRVTGWASGLLLDGGERRGPRCVGGRTGRNGSLDSYLIWAARFYLTVLGLVRLRVRKATVELADIFEGIDKKAAAERAKGASAESPFAEITDSDIDALFS